VEHENGPSLLIITRQGLPQMQRDATALENVRRGGYVLLDCSAVPQCIVMATGSEVSLALEAVQQAQAQGKRVRLVSMPCTEYFDAQDADYRDAVLPPAVRARVAVEAGSTGLWARYVGLDGRVIGIDHYGESGKAPELFKKFGFTADHVLIHDTEGRHQWLRSNRAQRAARAVRERQALRAADRRNQRPGRRPDQRASDAP
jgi:transketolase